MNCVELEPEHWNVNPNSNITTLAIYSKSTLTTLIDAVLGMPVTEPWVINDSTGFIIEPTVETVTEKIMSGYHNIEIYCQSYNMFRIMDGMTGPFYSN